MKADEAEMILRLLLPRFISYGRKKWQWTGKLRANGRHRGVKYHTALRMAPTKARDAFDVISAQNRPHKIERLDLRRESVYTIQEVLIPSTMAYALRHFDRVQRWPEDRLPYLFRFRRKIVIWNGTHRAVASIMLGRKLRCRVVDVVKNQRRR